ncbi:uncharacterized protein GGS25DRAFT_474870 [Hypoxylon fragiforme]|uniref:uncharacterized protein n=1 Tax=Hypoxylon fragiforme TaxID=63214 RepID=UPI0020C5E9AA|nr:uncharacterized protein GGS25DRAFT_474870 [Hypoxylon fragiforme]KAI2612323.1 hypothetical protein GGS25DRAFT_474870 [Hypoxylon fragiforme]
MTLSPEAIISIVGVLINIPPILLIIWTMWVRRRRAGRSTSSSGVLLGEDIELRRVEQTRDPHPPIVNVVFH